MARKPFVVLDAEILSSSVWAEAAHVRLVWITLLILCDTEGYVGASVPGIASAAGVTMDQAVEAISKLQEPDPYSRTKSHDGRRLEVAERGFRVLNFIEHLDRLSSERTKARERVRLHRKRKAERSVTEAISNASNVSVRSGSRDQRTGSREKTSTELSPSSSVPIPGAVAVTDTEPQGSNSYKGSEYSAEMRNPQADHEWRQIAASLRKQRVAADLLAPLYGHRFDRGCLVVRVPSESSLRTLQGHPKFADLNLVLEVQP